MRPEDPLQEWLEEARCAGPGPGFSERVMARVRATARRSPGRLMAVAALFCAGLGLALVRTGALCLVLLQSSMEAF